MRPIIKVENLSKQYRIGAPRPSYGTLRESITEAMSAPFKRFKRNGNSGEDTIWALKDVTFDVMPGEVLGIIGRNGAGKSTLLKVLSRITEPTAGAVDIYGRVGSLLEVGTGFHPELTGRENIFLNGAILGMKRTEIERKFDEIVAFAEIEKFLDTPVKHYSSGMSMRLAFAVAAHLDPEILLVDEVLAVGDAAFQKKCLGKMGDVAKQGRTVLFVSHNMAVVNRLCQQAFWLDAGNLLVTGPTEEVVARYLTSAASTDGQRVWKDGIANVGIDELKVLSASVINERGEITSSVDVCKSFSVEINYRIRRSLPFCRVGFLLSSGDGIAVFEAYDSDNEVYAGRREPGDYLAKCTVPPNLLNPGQYVISINAGMPDVKNLAFLGGVLLLSVADTGAVGSHMHSKREGVVRPELKWNCEVTLDEAPTAYIN